MDHSKQADATHGQRPSRRQFVQLTAVGAVTLGGGLLTACGGGEDLELEARKGGKTTVVDTPTIACDGSTQVSINIKITAGATTGAPAGVSLQWMSRSDFVNLFNGIWPSSDAIGLCKASFSGNANLARYTLGAGQSVTVNIGEFLFDNGASTNCPGALACGTEYVFRAFAHATSTMTRSANTPTLTCSTLACGAVGTCSYTQGYWKTHGPIPTGNNANEWPVTSLSLGTVGYTDLELLAIFNTPAQGNGLIALAHQLIAAKLNAAKGADASAVAGSIAAADTLIAGLVVPPVGSGQLAPSLTSALTGALAAYNEGATGPGHCE